MNQKIRMRLYAAACIILSINSVPAADLHEELQSTNDIFVKEQSRQILDIGHNFTAIAVNNAANPLIIPPNAHGAVGPEQYILMSYNAIRSFNKSSGNADGILDIDAMSFFNALSNDVRITYDPFAQRWFLSCVSINPDTDIPDKIILAMSPGPVIRKCSKWTFFTIPNTTLAPQIKPSGTAALNYQQVATDEHAVYISADTFDQHNNFCGTSTIVLLKNKLLAGSSSGTVFSGIFPGTSQKTASEVTPPANNFDEHPNYAYLINASNNVYGSGKTYTKIYMYRILDPWTTEPILGPMVTITVPAYADPANAPHKGNLMGSHGYLQTGDCNLTTPHIRNHQLYVCHTTQVDCCGNGTPEGDRVGVRWYQFDLTGDTTGNGGGLESAATVPALIQSGTLYDSLSRTGPRFYFNPSLITNRFNDLMIGCTIAGKKKYANALIAARNSSHELGSMSIETEITNSNHPYNFGPYPLKQDGNIGQRWGDLSSMCVDPVNDTDIWSTQEFAAINNGWGAQATQLRRGGCWGIELNENNTSYVC